jgi:hypothetical protein
MRFPAARSSERQDILTSIKKRTVPQNSNLLNRFSSKPGKIKAVEIFLQRQIRFPQPP